MRHQNFGDLTSTPLTMSSLEIAGLCGKRHAHVIRDIKRLLIELHGKEEADRRVPEHRRNRHSEYIREHADEIFSALADHKPNWVHEGLQGVTWSRDDRGYIRGFNLPKRETLILVSGYSTEMRARIIDRWMELEAAIATPAAEFDLSPEMRRVIGGIVKSIVHAELANARDKIVTELGPAQTEARLKADKRLAAVEHRPAFDLLVERRVPQKGRRTFSQKVSRRLHSHSVARGFPIREDAMGRYIFHVDCIAEWLAIEGDAMIRDHIARCYGQSVIVFPPIEKKKRGAA